MPEIEPRRVRKVRPVTAMIAGPNRDDAVPDQWPPLRRSNEFPWGELIGGSCLAAIPITIILILIFR